MPYKEEHRSTDEDNPNASRSQAEDVLAAVAPNRVDRAKKPQEIRTIEDLPELVLTAEVAQVFRISMVVARKWISEGRFPNAFTRSGGYLVPKQDVIDYMKSLYGKI